MRVEKLEGTTRCSSIVEEVPFMRVGMKVDDTPSLGDGKVIEIGIKKARVEYGDRVCFHCHKKGHIQYTCNKLKKDLRSLKLLREMKKPTMEVGDGEKRKGKKREVLFEKVRKAITLKKGVVVKGELPNLDEEGLVKKTKSNIEDGQVLLAKCDDDGDWVFDSVRPYRICRDKSLFTRVMACEHERVPLPSGEEVVIEAIGEVHLRMHNGIERKLRGVRYIPKMMRNLISLRKLEKIEYSMKTQSDRVLKVAKGCLVHLKGVMGNNGHVLLRSGGLHHVERDARPKSRRVTFDDGGHNDRWCTKKVDDGFGLDGEPRPKSYVEVVIGTPRKVAYDDRGRLGLQGRLLEQVRNQP